MSEKSAVILPLLIVDGFNVIRATDRYSFSDVDDFESDPVNRSREKLISDVSTFALGRYEAVIVFDGGGNISSQGSVQKAAGIEIVFSSANVDADQTIEKLAFQAQNAGREVLVVSSDAQIQNTVFKTGVRRMSSKGFAKEMQSFDEDIAESAENYGKFTIESRIDPEVKKKLDDLLHNKKLT